MDTNSINIQRGERLSFFKLFSEKNFRVFIPIIQRDYAQGRPTTREVRTNFLTALYDYLDEGKPNRDLDFVYGTITQEDDVKEFIPLDGQQRLTTLFLLHWYLCLITKDEDARKTFHDAICRGGKSMFTYRTRSSSSEFCDALVFNGLDMSALLPSDYDDKKQCLNNEMSKTIKNSSWFYMSWRHDPTIQSMLTMLDSIHHKFQGKGEFLPLLLDQQNPVITFLFLDLDIFKMTDDLYIKMNSRGKPLTGFENFKAKYEQSLEAIDLNKRTFYLSFQGASEKVSLKRYFSYNVDTKWADLFWNYRDLQNRSGSTSGDFTFDDEMMNFIRVIFTNKYAAELNLASKTKDDTLEYLRGAESARKSNPDYSDVISYHKYKEFGLAFDKDDEERLKVKPAEDIFILQQTKEDAYGYALALVDALDTFSNGTEPIRKCISDNYKYYYDENAIFKQALKHEFDKNHDRICFHAYLRFLIENKGDTTGLDEWMRVISNLSHPENTIIDEGADIAGALRSVEQMLSHSKDILTYLKSSPNIPQFSSWQVQEEIIKAHLITLSEKWKDAVESTEKHGYFNSQIGFILDFAGIIDYYREHKDCKWGADENEKFLNAFKAYSVKASAVFEKDYDHRVNDKDYVFERAVFTKGSYLFPGDTGRKNLLSTSVVKNNVKRDHSWKRFLRLSDDKDWRTKQGFVKAVLDDERFNVNSVHDSLASIAADKTNTWRDMFIDSPGIFSYCEQGFILINDEKSITLFHQSQINHLHKDLCLEHLWMHQVQPNLGKYSCFSGAEHKSVKSEDEDSYIVLKGYKHDRIAYEVLLYYYPYEDDGIQGNYELSFRKASASNNKLEDYKEDITDIINSLGLEWNEDYQAFFWATDDSDAIISKLDQLCESLPYGLSE